MFALALPRRVLLGLSVAAVSIAVFAAVLAGHIGGDQATRQFDLVALMVPSLFAALACWAAASRVKGRTGLGWLALGLSASAWGLGQGASAYYQVVLDKPLPFPSAADIGFLGAVPFAVIALLLFAKAPQGSISRVRTVLDGLAITGSVLFVGWIVVLGPMYHASSARDLAANVGFAYPLGDVVVASIALLVLANAARRPQLRLAVIATGLVVLAVADSGFSYMTNHGTYAIGSAVDYGWFAGYLLIALAALSAEPVPATQRDVEDRRRASGLSIVYVPVLVAVGTAIGRIAADNPLGRFPKELAAGLVVVLTGRELLVQVENVRARRRNVALAQLLGRRVDEDGVVTDQPVLTSTAP
jgi:hypothetical protein